ncbi:ribonuclease Oy-like [Chelydra serpentina]|uniref:Ribonuclease Oy-like n=1 Tax=Chelydra serpentina TaxID=8475 RepID=A0A8T1SHW6_CHESE|nr:ribonuclease Oy-like [Chelydra serpentina]
MGPSGAGGEGNQLFQAAISFVLLGESGFDQREDGVTGAWNGKRMTGTMARGAVLVFLWLAGAEMLREEQVERIGFCSWKCMKFVQLWPGSFCVALGPKFDCVIPESADSWTIHGLWPSNVMNCCGCWQLFPSDLMDLPKQLAQHWPTFLNASSFKFWRAEWQKHGTCAGCMEALSSPSKYFGAALGLRTLYNVDGAFQKAGILPSCNHSYQLHTLQEALVPVLGKEHQLQCVTDGQARQVLVQLKVSLFSNFSAGCLEEGARDFSPYRPCENQRRVFYFPPNQKTPRDPCP